MRPLDGQSFSATPIGKIISPYREKFAIPRQPGLVSAASSRIQLENHCNREEILRGLEGFSHIWIVFVFHQALRETWKPMVRPPRLGGNQKVGVFASRSPYRPNAIGISVVEVSKIDQQNGQWCVHFNGGDLLNETPVLDIKPYLPYADAIPDAQGAYAQEAPVIVRDIEFSPQARQQTEQLTEKYPKLEQLITQVLGQQPQPAYQRDTNKDFGMALYDLNIRWTNTETTLIVNSIKFNA
ncbi:MAG: tRNA (N6-threonylcarbamoyladenosine(37)-N6)-methyltransferase TrmO [Cellvibrionaceae bacterium]